MTGWRKCLVNIGLAIWWDLILGLTEIMISLSLSLFFPLYLIHYVQTTMVGENLGAFGPRGGVRDGL